MGGTVGNPVLLDPVLDDPGLVDRLVDEHQPYWPVQRYMANSAEYAALSGDRNANEVVVGPVFRGDWAVAGRALPGAEPLLDHAGFAETAKEVFGGSLVRPTTVYANLTWQLPFAQGKGHTDIPAFRGFDRTEHPVTFLSLMGSSGLFEDVRVKVATAVAWFHDGRDGGFEYWPDGPDAPSVVHEGAIRNTAVVADNDVLWHRVRPTGRVEDGMPSLTLDSELLRLDADTWAIVDGDREVARFPRRELRVSVSWKAVVFTDEADRRRHDEHTDDIDLAEVVARLASDLDRRGVEVDLSGDPRRDPTVLRALQETYVRYPMSSAA
jgi:hypothetical protein